MEALNSACVDFSYCKCILEMLDVGPESITQCVSIVVSNLKLKLEVTCFLPDQNLKTTSIACPPSLHITRRNHLLHPLCKPFFQVHIAPSPGTPSLVGVPEGLEFPWDFHGCSGIRRVGRKTR